MATLDYSQTPSRRISPWLIWLVAGTFLLVSFALVVLFAARWAARKAFPETVPGEWNVSLVRIKQVRYSMEQYNKQYGEYPIGTNRQMIRQLAAQRPDGQPGWVISERSQVHSPQNAGGEVVDGWGRPLVMLGGGTTRPVVYSAGPNGLDDGGTGDDLVPDPQLDPSIW